MNRYRILLAIFAAFLFSGCGKSAIVISGIEPGIFPDGKTSILVGRSQYFFNGVAVAPGSISSNYPPSIMNHVSPFTGYDAINYNIWVPGQWAIRAFIDENGYFAVNLPPGRYYFVEFGYVSLKPGFIGWRTYQSTSGTKLVKPFVMTFDILPGKATYIGTMQHYCMDLGDHKTHPIQGGIINIKTIDETQIVTHWLNEKYPEWTTNMETKLIETHELE